MLEAIWLGVVSNSAFFVVGLVVQRSLTRFRLRLPARYWRRVLGRPNVLAALSARQRNHPTNPDIPLLEVHGADIVSKNLAMVSIQMTLEAGSRLGPDAAKGLPILIVGGSETNPEYARFMQQCPTLPWKVEESADGKRFRGSNIQFEPTVDSSGLRSVDHALVVYGYNPRDLSQRAILVAGTVAIATKAGLTALADREIQRQVLREIGQDCLALIIEARLANESVLDTRVVASHRFSWA